MLHMDYLNISLTIPWVSSYYSPHFMDEDIEVQKVKQAE